MDWDAYTVFSVLSGIIMVIFGIAVSQSTKNRAWIIGGGAFFVVFGFYVAAQTSGTFVFPVLIFLVPFAAIAYLIYKRWEKSSGTGRSTRSRTAGPGSGSATVAGVIKVDGAGVDEVVKVQADSATIVKALREGVTAQRSAPVLVGGLWQRVGRWRGVSWAWGNNDDPVEVLLDVALSLDGQLTRCHIRTRGTGKTYKARQDIEAARIQILAILDRLNSTESRPDQPADSPAPNS